MAKLTEFMFLVFSVTSDALDWVFDQAASHTADASIASLGRHVSGIIARRALWVSDAPHLDHLEGLCEHEMISCKRILPTLLRYSRRVESRLYKVLSL